MRDRCPSSKFIRKAYLEGYKFIYDGYSEKRKGAVANIIKFGEEDVVWGGIFAINEDNLSALDCHEGYPKNYDRKIVEVKDDQANIYETITYFRLGQIQGAPHEDYRNVVLQGAKDCDLPDDYIRSNL